MTAQEGRYKNLSNSRATKLSLWLVFMGTVMAYYYQVPYLSCINYLYVAVSRLLQNDFCVHFFLVPTIFKHEHFLDLAGSKIHNSERSTHNAMQIFEPANL